MREGDLREELQTKELALEQLEEARQEAVAQVMMVCLLFTVSIHIRDWLFWTSSS